MSSTSSSMKVYCVRLVKGDDLKLSLQAFVKDNQIKSGFIITCVGSVSRVTLRFATQQNGDHEVKTLHQNFEITSMVGTLSTDGSHLHLTLSDSMGQVIGGHLMGDCTVQTTAEVVIGYMDDVEFKREFDPSTGYNELVIRPQDNDQVDLQV